MTRAVIKLPNDISYAMPIMKRGIEGFAYNAEVPVAAFRYKSFSVVVEKNRITIYKYNANDEAIAVEVMNFLKDIVTRANEIMEKVKIY